MNRSAPAERLHDLWNNTNGLDAAQVVERRATFGPNTIVAESPSGWLEIVRSTVSDPMIWFLIGTAFLFIWLGDLTEAAVLGVALIPIAGMDAYLHRRTQASTEGLRARLASQARVLRDGHEQDVLAEDLVPGDLVIVPSGAYFPADGLIQSGDALQADESTLTGEALPVRKAPLGLRPVGTGSVTVDGEHWGMAGTRLLTGEARVVIALTGAETLYGEIARLSRATQVDRTPLQDAIARLVQILLVVALLLCVILAGIRYAQGYGAVDALLSAVTLAIAALPEEFPVVFSFFLGLGVYRLARKQALVRRAVVVENIGRISCICTDKTGTLTDGKLTLNNAHPAEGLSDNELLAIAATASRAETADPLDLILLESARASNGKVEAVFPFTEDRLREVAVLRSPKGNCSAAMKGAPETVIGMTTMSEEKRDLWRQRTQELAASGHKVIGVAIRSLQDWSGEEPETGFDFAGLLAFSDPVRPSVADAVREAQDAGIRVIMITGDHARTAAAIAQEIGIGAAEPRVIDGKDLAAHLDRQEARIDFDVVARCTPSQKLALVQALRAKGEMVAVTGDGVNDAPALRGADVGIAMGERGTRSAREVASIVLLDDNFATIVGAIAEGRQLFTNLRLSFAYLLMLHAPLVATAALIPLMGYPLLYLPIHIIWIELILHPTALLVFQNLPSQGMLSHRSKGNRLSFFAPREWLAIGLVGTLASAVILGGYILNLGETVDVPHARSMAMASLIIAGSAITAALTRLGSRSAWIATVAPVLSAFAAIQIEPIATVLHLSPLHPIDWVIAVFGGVIISAGAAFLHQRQDRSTPDAKLFKEG
ncbi:cation-translocating P-type ATPase [Boseongicola aestuarii]|uniref:P-type Cu(+) transporter n=1 Tax=Boseongicola aestuarii TaxID=1470561 RepID=A0A238J6X0_9RHOB|nr:cation-transporting P-type ATPase [Boseongicola aestuarii]SMX25700.1 Calcium-transporting ATPase 1 [Boseongicola aestuarii]